MSLATVRSGALAGVTATPVVVEVHLGGGLPGMAIVGLPQSAVKESKDRVRAAIRHAGFRFPRVKVIVNLAPADLPKRGGRFDLPITLGILVASGRLAAPDRDAAARTDRSSPIISSESYASCRCSARELRRARADRSGARRPVPPAA